MKGINLRQKASVLTIIALSLVAISSVAWAQDDCLITVSYSKFKLVLSGKNMQPLEFIVATPVSTPKVLPIEATVSGVELYPPWYPTKATREDYLRDKHIILPKTVETGDPRNAMGRGIIRLRYLRPGLMNANVVIHGNNDEKSIGKNVSRGCIRMHNRDIEIVISIIKNKKTRVIFEK